MQSCHMALTRELREHLYRRHQLPPQCSRCCQAFDSDSKLKEHSRLPDGCALRNEKPLEGFDKDQEKRLRSRKKGFLGDSRDDQWKEIYLVLFPDTLLPEIPSPYYDYDEDSKQGSNHSPTSVGFARYEAYLSRELPRSVRRELEIAMESELGPIEEKLKSQLEVIVRSCQERLFKMYQEAAQQSHDCEEAEHAVDIAGSEDIPGPSYDTSVLSNLATTDDLAAYEMPPAVSHQIWDDFIGGTGPEAGLPSDSAYESMSAGSSRDAWAPPYGSYPTDDIQPWCDDHDPTGNFESWLLGDNQCPTYKGKGKEKQR
jgi:hypothetical protein